MTLLNRPLTRLMPSQQKCLRQIQTTIIVLTALRFVALALAQTPDAIRSGQVQCTLSLKSSGYSHQETQTWRLTGEAPKMTGEIAVYPATWSVSGEGAGQRTVNAQFLSAMWKSSVAPINAPIAMFVRLNGRLVIKSFHSQLSSPKSVAVTRQTSLLGANPSQTTMVNTAYEWLMPAIEDSATSISISGSGTIVVGSTSIPERPGGSNQVANCTWQFTRSSKGSNPSVTLPVASPLQLTLTSSSSNSGTQSSTSGTGTSSSSSSSQGSSQTASGALQMLPPSVRAGAGSLTLSWKSPANDGGLPVDTYDIEVNSGTSTSTLTIAAPSVEQVVPARACPDTVSCLPNSFANYRFRIRAHSSSGYGPYSDYTPSVRPLLSYLQDLSQMWARLQCTGCHTHQGGADSLFLDGAPQQTYDNIVSFANAIADPPGNSRMLTYPSHQQGRCGSSSNQFTVTSPEYLTIRQWIVDGKRY